MKIWSPLHGDMQVTASKGSVVAPPEEANKFGW